MQGNCGSCWAHAGVSAIEAKLLIQDGLLSNETSVSLSIQQVVSYPGGGCTRGVHHNGVCAWHR